MLADFRFNTTDYADFRRFAAEYRLKATDDCLFTAEDAKAAEEIIDCQSRIIKPEATRSTEKISIHRSNLLALADNRE
jgi:hypothetical protein